MTDDTDSNDRLEEFAALSTLANPTASPTGEEIALYYDVTGRNELHVLDAASGKLTQWSDGEVPRDSGAPLFWGADGDRVYFHSDEGGNEQYDVYACERDGDVEPVVQSSERNVLHDVDQEGKFLLVGSTREGQLHLYRHDLDGDGVTALTDGDSSVWWSVISPTGDRVAYAAGEASDVAVYVAAADGSWQRELSVGTAGSETRVADWNDD